MPKKKTYFNYSNSCDLFHARTTILKVKAHSATLLCTQCLLESTDATFSTVIFFPVSSGWFPATLFCFFFLAFQPQTKRLKTACNPPKGLLPWKTTFGDDERFEQILRLHDKQKLHRKEAFRERVPI